MTDRDTPADILARYVPAIETDHKGTRVVAISTAAQCPECGRTFDLTDADDAAEWAYGHDCEDGG